MCNWNQSLVTLLEILNDNRWNLLQIVNGELVFVVYLALHQINSIDGLVEDGICRRVTFIWIIFWSEPMSENNCLRFYLFQFFPCSWWFEGGSEFLLASKACDIHIYHLLFFLCCSVVTFMSNLFVCTCFAEIMQVLTGVECCSFSWIDKAIKLDH